MLQVEPESLYAEEGLGLQDGDEVDHLMTCCVRWPLAALWVEQDNFSRSSGIRMMPLPRQSWPSWKPGRRRTVSGGSEPCAADALGGGETLAPPPNQLHS